MRPQWLVIILCAFIVACQSAPPPTMVTEVDQSLAERTYNFEKKSRPLKITPDTFVLDARSYFDYQNSHLPEAVYVSAKDLSLRATYGDDFKAKAVLIASRLALWGITPFTHVVVVGYGDKGHGEEGQVALALYSVGVEKVQMGSMADLKAFVTSKESKQRENARYWPPNTFMTNCRVPADKSSATIIHTGKKKYSPGPAEQGIAVLAMDWKEFVNLKDFSPNYVTKEKLAQNKVNEKTQIMVHGPEAPLAVFALLQTGFSRACLMDE